MTLLDTLGWIWLYLIVPAFFIFGTVSYKAASVESVSAVKLVLAALLWPLVIAITICAVIGTLLK